MEPKKQHPLTSLVTMIIKKLQQLVNKLRDQKVTNIKFLRSNP